MNGNAQKPKASITFTPAEKAQEQNFFRLFRQMNPVMQLQVMKGQHPPYVRLANLFKELLSLSVSIRKHILPRIPKPRLVQMIQALPKDEQRNIFQALPKKTATAEVKKQTDFRLKMALAQSKQRREKKRLPGFEEEEFFSSEEELKIPLDDLDDPPRGDMHNIIPWETVFYKEVRRMLHGLGDNKRPNPWTVVLVQEHIRIWLSQMLKSIPIEKYTVGGFGEVFPHQLDIFQRWQHMKKGADEHVGPKAEIIAEITDDKDEDDDDDDDEEPVVTTEVKTTLHSAAGEQELSEEVLNKLSWEVPELGIKIGWGPRLREQDELSSKLSQYQYMKFAHSREASFCSRRSKFFNWIGLEKDIKKSLRLFLGFIAWDRVGCLVQLVSGIRNKHERPQPLGTIITPTEIMRATEILEKISVKYNIALRAERKEARKERRRRSNKASRMARKRKAIAAKTNSPRKKTKTQKGKTFTPEEKSIIDPSLEKQEPLKKRKKPGPKPKKSGEKYVMDPLSQKTGSSKKRKKPGPKPKKVEEKSSPASLLTKAGRKRKKPGPKPKKDKEKSIGAPLLTKTGKIRKKPGPKPKKVKEVTSLDPQADKTVPSKKRKKPGPKPKMAKENNLNPQSDKTVPSKKRKKPGPKPKKPKKPKTSKETSIIAPLVGKAEILKKRKKPGPKKGSKRKKTLNKADNAKEPAERKKPGPKKGSKKKKSLPKADVSKNPPEKKKRVYRRKKTTKTPKSSTAAGTKALKSPSAVKTVKIVKPNS